MNNKITLATLVDWIGVYINGVLEEENHSINSFQLLDLVKDLGPFEVDQVWVSEEWMEDRAGLPADLTEVVLDV